MKHQITDTENVKQAVPFFLVSDMRKSVNYYVEGLGFKITNQWIDEGKLHWCWLQCGGAALMLQEAKAKEGNLEIDTAKSRERISIYFICEDAIKIYQEIISRGIPALKPFVGNGMWVTELSDPDGFKIYFESLTDVPEETEYV